MAVAVASDQEQVAVFRVNMTELRQTSYYSTYVSHIGWQVETSSKNVHVFVRKLPLVPVSLLKLQRASWEHIDFEWLRLVARRHHAVVSYIELLPRLLPASHPDFSSLSTRMKAHGYTPSNSVFLPSKTIRIDITPPLTTLTSRMKPKTRYNILVANKAGLQIKILGGRQLLNSKMVLDDLSRLLAENSKRKHYFGPSQTELHAQLAAFLDKAYVVLVYTSTNELAAGAIFWQTDNMVYYGHNGSTLAGRQKMAPTLAVWHGILEAKKRGLTEFDFDGVYDERFPLKRWLGFTRFKEGFGGTSCYFPPVYRRWFPGF